MIHQSLPLIITVTVIFVGVVLLLGNMGIIPANIVAFWPMILIIGGLVGLLCCGPMSPSKSASKRKK